MLKNYVKIYFRQLKKNKTTNIITIGGFAISLAIVMLFSSYILEELTVDKHLDNLENIYQVIKSRNDAAVEEIDKEHFYDITGVKSVTYFSNFCEENIRSKNRKVVAKSVNCDEEFFKMFSIPFIIGEADRVFASKKNVIISQSLAEKLFGNENPIGEIITIGFEKEFIISGIIENFPELGSIKADIFYHTESRIRTHAASYGEIKVKFSRIFIQLEPHAKIELISDYVNSKLLQNRREPSDPSVKINYYLSAFKESYFGEPIQRDQLPHANINLILLIGVVTIIVLLLSSLNYINISTASNFSRGKEFGIKKANGARKIEIFWQIIFESLLNISISILLGFIFFEFLNPIFYPLLERNISYAILFSNLLYSLSFVSVVILMSLIVGVYPAYKASITEPVTLMKYNSTSRESNISTNIFNTMQFVLSSILIVALVIVSQQSEHLKTKDLGFDTEQLIKIPTNYRVSERAKIVKTKLLQHSNIISVSNTGGIPGATQAWTSSKNYKSTILRVDKDFLKTFDIPLLEGRFFENSVEKVCVINEASLKDNEIENWKFRKVLGSEIIGIVKDFNHQNLYKKSGAITILPLKNSITDINVRINPNNIPETLEYIELVWEEIIPEFQFKYSFYDEWIDSLYKEEERNAKILKIFTVIAIFIGLFGLYGITELSVNKKVKEFSIRKVFGASIADIFILQNKGILKWNLRAFVIAAPISFYLLSNWLANYQHCIEISWYVYVVSGIVILGISFFTTSYKILKVAKANPVDSLRNE